MTGEKAKKRKTTLFDTPSVYIPPCPDTPEEARMNRLLYKSVYGVTIVLGGITVIAQIFKAFGF
jgi:hypothetical protein